MAYKIQQKLRDNIDAIPIALEWDRGQSLSENQLQSLKNYSGFGGLKAILYPNSSIEEWIQLNASKEDLKAYHQIAELHEQCPIGILHSRNHSEDYIQSIKGARDTASKNI